MAAIDTRSRDAAFRAQVVDLDARSVLVARISGTAQERDLSAPTNCDGFGRVRHFRRRVVEGWPDNPLPIVPAARWLRRAPPDIMHAQVFQLAACAWRCWYCYVPFKSMRADLATSAWRTAAALVDEYLALEARPPILDLSGGSPDLAPEWIAWTLDAIEQRDAKATTFLWSDDNLSSDRLLRPESRAMLARIARAENYGKACCLKGYDPLSFAFNTRAEPEGFERQLAILSGYARTGLDMYVYLPLVGPPDPAGRRRIEDLAQRLAAIRDDLPARTVPLFVASFGAMAHRMNAALDDSLKRQWELLAYWREIVPHQPFPS